MKNKSRIKIGDTVRPVSEIWEPVINYTEVDGINSQLGRLTKESIYIENVEYKVSNVFGNVLTLENIPGSWDVSRFYIVE